MPSSTAQPRLSSSTSSNARRSSFLEPLSQQLQTRRSAFHASQQLSQSLHGDSQDPLAGGSQFTSVLNFLTQPPALSQSQSGRAHNAASLTMLPNLTRFTSSATVAVMAEVLSRALHGLRVQFTLEPLGDTYIGESEEADGRDAIPAADFRMDDADEDMDTDEALQHGQDGENGREGMVRSTSAGSDGMMTVRGSPAPEGGMTTSASTATLTSAAVPSSLSTSTMSLGSIPEGTKGTRIRVSLTDSRKCQLKGEIRVERISGIEIEGGEIKSLVMMSRRRGSPLEWRRVFGKIVRQREVASCIAR